MSSSLVARPLHYVIKIGDRKKSYDFYVRQLGMQVLRHEEFGEGCQAECNGPYTGKWSKTMVGYGKEDDHFVIEMTYNYEIGAYKKGDDLHGLYVDSEEAAFKQLSSSSSLAATAQESRVLLRDPDSHAVFVGAAAGAPRVTKLALNVQDLDRSIAFWSDVLNMKVDEKSEKSAVLSYPTNSLQWSLQLNEHGKPIDRASAYGRVAFACPTEQLSPLEAAVKSSSGAVLKPLLSLDTPGKATVHVVILADPDGHEICFVGDEAFRELSQVDSQSDESIQKSIKDDWSSEWFTDGKQTI